MTQDELWKRHYDAYMSYMKTHNKRPSKHHLEDRELFNWFKHNKKIYTSGRMPFDRTIIFRHLLEVAEDCRMINQHAYVHKALLLLATLLCLPAWAQITVTQGYQTTGRGNDRCVLLHIFDPADTPPFMKALPSENEGTAGTAPEGPKVLRVTLKGDSRKYIRRVELYQTTGDEFYADLSPQQLLSVQPTEDTFELRLPATVKLQQHLWLTADIRRDAQPGATVDAMIEGLGDPDGEVRIYQLQRMVCIPTSHDCRFYRIPAMTLDRKGNIVVAYDKRYDSNLDLGNKRIDVAVRRSTDGGRTWSQQVVIAKGDATSDGQYGFGDPALARTAGGRLLCLMAAGKNGYFQGMRHIALSVSDDDGLTWSQPRELTARNFRDAVHQTTDSLGFWSIFTTSGKGLLTHDGTVMFATNTLMGVPVGTWEGSSDCYILSSRDEGEHWLLGPTLAYSHCDESKLVQMDNDSILLSVRQRGARGFNRADATAANWQQQWRNDGINNGNPCNADIIKVPYMKHTYLHTYLKHPSLRRQLVLAVSTDDCHTWHDIMTIQDGGAAYSTMEFLRNGHLALLFEDGSQGENNGYALTYVTLTARQLKSLIRENH